MTVCLETTIQRWNGLAADVKPASPPEGSTFHEVDTGKMWIYHDGDWEQDLRTVK